MYRNFFKRILDFLGAIFLLLVFSPLLILCVLFGIFLFEGKPFYRQIRIGYKEKVFYLLKFRTMSDRRNKAGTLLPDEQRLTTYGRILRRTSLDEIPQLFHIIIGEMSLVGPRPLLIKYLPWYSVAERRRHSVRPGISGLAQVKGRNALGWDARLQLDLQYVNHISLLSDLKIIIGTIGYIFSGKGFNADPRSEMLDLDIERKNKRSYRLNDQFLLRKPVLADVDQLLVVKNNKEARQLLVHQGEEYTREDIERWIRFHTLESENDMFVIEDIAEHMLIGHAALYDIDPLRQACSFGILIGRPAYWDKGIGKMVTHELMDIAFHELMLHEMFLEVMQSNTRAIQVYLSLRFEVIEEKHAINASGADDILFTMRREHDD